MKKIGIFIGIFFLIGLFGMLIGSTDIENENINNSSINTNSNEVITEVQNNEQANNDKQANNEVPNDEQENKIEHTSSIDSYNIGDEILLGQIKFNIYKIDKSKKELHLLAQKNIATTRFSNENRSYKEEHDYEGSLIEGYVNRFVDDLEDQGYNIKSSGIIDKDDLYDLGFIDSVTVSGRPYLCDNVPEFVKYEKNYWLDGYYRVDTYAWVYFEEKIDTKNCEGEYGVRPTIVIKQSEVNKQPKVIDSNLTIKEMVDSDCAWTSEGGISNSYDRFYFDIKNMLFINVFESPVKSSTDKYTMKFIDEKTIQVDGGWYNDLPAQLTIVDNNKLRVRFLDDDYNKGDYYLNKTNE